MIFKVTIVVSTTYYVTENSELFAMTNDYIINIHWSPVVFALYKKIAV